MAESGKVEGGAAIFVVRDVERSAEYFRDALGSSIAFRYGEPVRYAGVERVGLILHLQSAGRTKRLPGNQAVYAFATDVDSLFEQMKANGAKVVGSPKDYPYGMRDFTVADLDGNEVSFGMEVKGG